MQTRRCAVVIVRHTLSLSYIPRSLFYGCDNSVKTDHISLLTLLVSSSQSPLSGTPSLRASWAWSAPMCSSSARPTVTPSPPSRGWWTAFLWTVLLRFTHPRPAPMLHPIRAAPLTERSAFPPQRCRPPTGRCLMIRSSCIRPAPATVPLISVKRPTSTAPSWPTPTSWSWVRARTVPLTFGTTLDWVSQTSLFSWSLYLSSQSFPCWAFQIQQFKYW